MPDRRRLRHPRLYTMTIEKDGRVISRMLGVAFTVAERQRYYAQYRNYDWQANHPWCNSCWKVTLHSERLDLPGPDLKTDKLELSAAETARRMGVSLKYVYDLLAVGRLQARKVDAKWCVSTNSVGGYLKKRAGWEKVHA